MSNVQVITTCMCHIIGQVKLILSELRQEAIFTIHFFFATKLLKVIQNFLRIRNQPNIVVNYYHSEVVMFARMIE